MGVQGYFLKKKEALHAEIIKRMEKATGCYSAEVDFLL